MNNTLTKYLYQGDLKNALILIKDGIDVNKEIDGILPITSAINSDNPEILQFIIDCGADVNINFGQPVREMIDYCIDAMIQNGTNDFNKEHKLMLKILIDNNADLLIKNKEGEIPTDIIKDYAFGETFNFVVELFHEFIPEIYKLIDERN